jgi:hypothetical protein
MKRNAIFVRVDFGQKCKKCPEMLDSVCTSYQPQILYYQRSD